MAEMRISPRQNGFTVHIGDLEVGLVQINGVLWIEFQGDNYKPPFATIRMDEEDVEFWTSAPDTVEGRSLYKRSADPHRIRREKDLNKKA